jgi:integrase
MKRGHYGSGSIDPSGENSWRLRYRIAGKRHTKVVKGTKTEAAKELRRLLHDGDTGQHVAPDRVTLGEWADRWIAIGAPGMRKKKVGARTLERYDEFLRCHIKPALGKNRLQQLRPSDIDKFYAGLDGKISPQTAHNVHVVLNACLETAIRKGLLSVNPIARAEKVPSPGEADHGIAVDADQLRALVEGFKKSALFPIVATLAFTGCRPCGGAIST